MQNMRIRNKQNKGYLAVADIYSQGRYRVHTTNADYNKENVNAGIASVAASPPFVSLEKAKWNLFLDESTGQFQIRNVKFDEALYADDDKLQHDKYRRIVYSRKSREGDNEGSRKYWTLVKYSDPDNGQFYLIKNVQYNEYLYNEPWPSTDVYTRKNQPQDGSDEKFLWQLINT